MHVIAKQYYKTTVYLLFAIGLWPYASKKFRQIQNVVVSFFLWLPVVTQLGTFVTCKYNMKLFLKNLSPICVSMGCAFKYHIMLYRLKNVKDLLEQMNHDWTSLYVEEELTIVKEHAEMGKYYARIFALFLYPSILGFMVSLLVSDYVNVVLASNESRRHEFPVMVETIFDQQKHFYFFIGLVAIVLLTIVTTYVASEGFAFICLQHVAGMLKIVSYRIRGAIIPDLVKNEASGKKLDALKFASAMKIHIRALTFQKYLNSEFIWSYLILLGLGVVALSINMLRFSLALDAFTDFNELVISGFMVTGQLAYMYYLNYVVESVLDCSNNIFRELYNTTWYEAPVALQNLLLFAMAANVKPIDFNICGVYDASIEGFSLIFKTTLSYFMVLQSIQ